MGTWGPGNFEGDGPLDYVGGLVDQLTDTINSCFEDDNADLDEGGEDELMPSVFVLSLLAEHCGAAPPKPDVIESWRDRYVAIYDEQIDGLDPDAEYKVERRKVIAETFAALLHLSNAFWSP